jgi:putative ABC transport system permease protein
VLNHNLKTAWRNMLHNKVNSFINVAGLSIGICCTILIVLFIRGELSFDRFHKNADHLFQVTLNGNFNGNEFWGGNTAPPVGQALAANIPEIESYSRIYKPADLVVRTADNQRFFTEKNILAVDSTFLQLFSFKVLEGNAATAIQPGSIVLTKEMAAKYFGEGPAIGKILLVNKDKKPFTVSAVVDNVPAHSSIRFDFLTATADYPVIKQFSWSWIWRQTLCFVKLRDQVAVDPAAMQQLESRFPAVVRVQAANGFRRIGKPFDEFIRKGGKWDLHLLPVTDIHLRSNSVFMPWLNNISNIRYVYIFGSIAIFILLLACVNFMNLSTARAAKRGREVGIRKVSGSTRGQLIRQFLAEALLYSIVSAIMALFLVVLLLKPFSMITGEAFEISQVFNLNILGIIVVLVLITGLLAGSYPAFYLTRFNPVTVLKGNGTVSTGKGSQWFRNALVIFQFSVATMMIIGTLVIYRQLVLFRNADLGFDRDNVVVINNTRRLGVSEESFRQSISQLQGIAGASTTTSIPSGGLFQDSYVPEPEQGREPVQELNLSSFLVGYDFITTLHMQVLKGRNFSDKFSDSLSVIVNEEAAKQAGWGDPIGKYLQYPGGNNEKYKVVGVVKDFNVTSLHTPIQAFALFHSSSKSYDVGVSHIVARIVPGQVSQSLSQLEAQWKKFAPAEPFDYRFLDEAFGEQYRSEQRLGNIFGIFSGLSIFIACLGLFGLCAYVAEKRTREIGVRKVLGASVRDIVGLLSGNFIRLTLVAAVIAFPVAWWVMNKWLEDFAYRTAVSWWLFALAGLLVMLIALLTISSLAIKAARANPVKSLRTE